MTRNERSVTSFVIRLTQDLWRDSEGAPQVEWRGQIRHVQGEEEAAFTDFAEAVAFIQHHMARLTLDALEGSEEEEKDEALRSSFHLWERLASQYTELMFGSAEMTVRGSEAMRSQMDRAIQESLQVWGLPGGRDYSQIEHELRALTSGLQDLEDRIDRLQSSLEGSTEVDPDGSTSTG